MPSSSASRPWWRSPGPLVALLLHAVVFLGFFELHFKPGEWAQMEKQLPAHPTTGQWIHVLVGQHGMQGLATWFFDTHREIHIYHRYAEVVLRGVDPEQPANAPGQGHLMPYRDVAMEYQPGALLVFLPPALLAKDLPGYQTWFVVWCGVLYVGAILLGLKLLAGDAPIGVEQANRTLWWSLAFLLCFGGVAAARFDHTVPFLILVACWMLRRADRTGSLAWFAATGVVIAAGVFVKIVPGLLLPAALLWLGVTTPRPAWRPMIALTAGLVVALLGFHVASYTAWGDGYLRSYTYQLDRGIQLESTYAGMIALSPGFGLPLRTVEVAHAYDLATPLAGLLKALAPVLFLALVALTAMRVWTTRRAATRPSRDFTVALLATVLLLAFILTNKVFSPQYLLWLGPLVAAAYGVQPTLRQPAFALLFAAALSQAIFPHLYDQLRALQPLPVFLLNLRNLTLVAILGWLLVRLPRLLAPPPAVSP
jgi:hypothetical protein